MLNILFNYTPGSVRKDAYLHPEMSQLNTSCRHIYLWYAREKEKQYREIIESDVQKG